MKNIIILIGISILFSSCRIAYDPVSMDQNRLNLFNATTIDSTFLLFIKTICKTNENGINQPCDCYELSTDSVSVIEAEFMFLSAKRKEAIVINYLKDRTQKFYNKSRLRFDLLPGGDDTLNIARINQIRFGTYDEERQEISFETTSKNPEKHIWELKITERILSVESVSVEVPDGFDLKSTDLSLALMPRFFPSNSFEIIFREPVRSSRSKPNTNPVTPLSKNTIYVDTTGNDVYFHFDSAVIRTKNTVRFKSNRLYSYFINKPAPSEDFRKNKMVK